MGRADDDGSTSRAGDRVGSLVEAVADLAIFKLDRHGHVLTWNAGAERILGYRREEIVGQHVSALYDGSDNDGRADEELRSAMARGSFEDEGWHVRRDGSRFWASVGFTPLSGDGGRLSGFAAVIRDETSRLRAAEEARRLLAVEARQAVAHDLHHEVVQRLFTVGLAIDSLRSSAERPEMLTRLDALGDSVDAIIRHIRVTLWKASSATGDGVVGANEDADAETAGLSILVVDDDEDMRALVSEFLSELGTVKAVPDAYQALAWIDANPVDVIVVDLLLPGANGAELLERLAGRGHRIPALVVSGLDDGELAERAHNAGAVMAMSKPFDRRLLRANVVAAARSSQRR